MITKRFKLLIKKISHILYSVSSAAELKLDAFIFSKEKKAQIRALISGTGLYITIPMDRLIDNNNFILRFSIKDREIINNIVNDKTDLYSRLIEGRKIEVIAKTIDRVSKKTALTISVIDYYNKNIEFEIDPTELSRNKFLLQLFNKNDAFNIGYSAAENRIRTEQMEIIKAKNIIQNIS